MPAGTSTVVGSLLVNLGMESAEFTRGATQAQSKIAQVGKSFGISAKQVQEASGRMGVSVGQFASQMQALQERVNPAAVALERYRREAAMLKEGLRAGILTQDQFNTSLRQAIQGYRSASQGAVVANDNIVKSTGSMKAGVQQLNYQLGDMATMWAMGAKPQQIFASQAGQTIQAIQLMTNGAGKFSSFLAGPWGAALTTAVVVLSALAPKLLETGDAADSAAGRVDGMAASLERLAKAQGRVAMTDLGNAQANVWEKRNELRTLQSARARASGNIGLAGGLPKLDERIGAAQDELNKAQNLLNLSKFRADIYARADERARVANASKPTATRSSSGRSSSGQTDDHRSDKLAAEEARRQAEQYETTKAQLELERRLGELRGSGNEAQAMLADMLENRARLEAQFPQLAKSTRLEDQLRLEVLVDIANASDAEARHRQTAADAARDQVKAEEEARRLFLEEHPLVAYMGHLRDSVGNINSAMENIQVGAIDNLTNGIAGAISGTQKLGDVFKNVAQQIIADLIRIQIQKALVGALGNALGFGGATIGGMTGKEFSAGLGKSVAGWAANTQVSVAGARANGGPVRAGLPYLIGERGPEIVVPSQSGQVIPNHELAGMGGGSFHFDLRGAVMTQDLLAQMNAIGENAAMRGSINAQVAAARKQHKSLR